MGTFALASSIRQTIQMTTRMTGMATFFSYMSAFSTHNYEQLVICIHLDVIILVLTNYTLQC